MTYVYLYLPDSLSLFKPDPGGGSFAKCHGQTGFLSLSGTEIVKDRPDTLSINGPPVCPSQTSHWPSDAMRAFSNICGLNVCDGSVSFSRARLSI